MRDGLVGAGLLISALTKPKPSSATTKSKRPPAVILSTTKSKGINS